MKKVLTTLAMILLLGVFCYSAYHLGGYLISSIQANLLYGGLRDDVEALRPTRPAIVEPTGTEPNGTNSTTPTLPEDTTAPTEPEYVTITDPKTGEPMEILREYSQAYLKNTDMVGWIEVPDTRISYPVVQSPYHPNYYLDRNFEKKYDVHGCIYAGEACDINEPSDNIILYGHRMKDEGMFAQLDNYTDIEYYKTHKYLYFDTLTERHTYKIISVFATSANPGEGFTYHTFIDADNEAAFNAFVKSCKDWSMYDIPTTAEYGDKLLTLSTCEYTYDNGRLVVVAKRID